MVAPSAHMQGLFYPHAPNGTFEGYKKGLKTSDADRLNKKKLFGTSSPPFYQMSMTKVEHWQEGGDVENMQQMVSSCCRLLIEMQFAILDEINHDNQEEIYLITRFLLRIK